MQQLTLQQHRALGLNRQNASIAWHNNCFSRLQVGSGANVLQQLYTLSADKQAAWARAAGAPWLINSCRNAVKCYEAG